MRPSASREAGGIAAEKIRFLLHHIAEAGQVSAGRAAAVCGSVFEAVVLTGNMSAVIMECKVFTQYAAVVAQAIWKALGC